MPLYIKDDETSTLAEKLAKSAGTSKTELVRRLLREEAERAERSRTVQERIRAINEISRKGGEIMRKYYPDFKYGKKEADEVFAYLDEEAEAPIRKSRKKAG